MFGLRPSQERLNKIGIPFAGWTAYGLLCSWQAHYPTASADGRKAALRKFRGDYRIVLCDGTELTLTKTTAKSWNRGSCSASNVGRRFGAAVGLLPDAELPEYFRSNAPISPASNPD